MTAPAFPETFPAWMAKLPDFVQRTIWSDWYADFSFGNIAKLTWNADPNYFNDNVTKSKITIETTVNQKYSIVFNEHDETKEITKISHYWNGYRHCMNEKQGQVFQIATKWLTSFLAFDYNIKNVHMLPVAHPDVDLKIRAESVILNARKDDEDKRFISSWLRAFRIPIDRLSIMQCNYEAKIKNNEHLRRARVITIQGNTDVNDGVIETFEGEELIILENSDMPSSFNGKTIAQLLLKWTIEVKQRHLVLHGRQFPANFWDPIGTLLKKVCANPFSGSYTSVNGTYKASCRFYEPEHYTLRIRFDNDSFDAEQILGFIE